MSTASRLWLVTTMSASRARAREASAKHSAPYGQRGAPTQSRAGMDTCRQAVSSTPGSSSSRSPVFVFSDQFEGNRARVQHQLSVARALEPATVVRVKSLAGCVQGRLPPPADAVAEKRASLASALIERAYRGPAAARGWTNESELLAGPRSSAAEVERLIWHPQSRFVMALANGQLVGAALLQRQRADPGDLLAASAALAEARAIAADCAMTRLLAVLD